jgi:SnoaL-like domain
MSTETASRFLESAKRYFEEIDGGRLPLELFAPDFEFYFPKYGVGRGWDEFMEFATGLGATGHKAIHHRAQLNYICCGTQVIVEGATFGSDGKGGTWNGGETPGGRFCSVFHFNDEGLVKRMYIYLDPDYAGRDADRFHWHRRHPRW